MFFNDKMKEDVKDMKTIPIIFVETIKYFQSQWAAGNQAELGRAGDSEADRAAEEGGDERVLDGGEDQPEGGHELTMTIYTYLLFI